MTTYLRGNLGLRGLLSVVGGKTLGLDTFSLGIFFFVRAEEVNIIIVLFRSLGRSSSRGSTTKESFTGFARAGKGAELSLIRLDVSVPAGNMWVGRCAGGRRDRLEDDNIRLRRGVPEDS